MTRAASPHTRGWTSTTLEVTCAYDGFPAHAGMDPGWRISRPGPERLPRTRGDGPRRDDAATAIELASPHTRGWTPTPATVRANIAGFPAHAGMDPCRRNARRPFPRLPRTRGDGPPWAAGQPSRTAASPHTRGWTWNLGPPRAPSPGFPAHAGMDP